MTVLLHYAAKFPCFACLHCHRGWACMRMCVEEGGGIRVWPLGGGLPACIIWIITKQLAVEEGKGGPPPFSFA